MLLTSLGMINLKKLWLLINVFTFSISFDEKCRLGSDELLYFSQAVRLALHYNVSQPDRFALSP